MATAVDVGLQGCFAMSEEIKEGLINVLNIAYSGCPSAVTC